MKIRIPKEMYDKISNWALENDMTFDEAILLCFKIGEAVEATDANKAMQWSTQYQPTTEDGEL
mgnify:CR=1 FL=1|jgi:hypothetical protein|tara:strand:- start:1878 stop:2066 length:189 start_codon:yes stop_codon:yes gene_type:complete